MYSIKLGALSIHPNLAYVEFAHSCWAQVIHSWNKILKISETVIIIVSVLVTIFTFSLETPDTNYWTPST